MITKAWLVDTAERVGLTFAETFAGGLLLAGAHLYSLSAVHTAALAGVAAALAAVKSAVASKLGNTVSPASLAPKETP